MVRLVLLALLLFARVGAADDLDPALVLKLAREGRYVLLKSYGAGVLPPLLGAYPGADRETRTAILLALGSLNVKSSEAADVLRPDVDGADTRFQQIHRYALQAVDPDVRSAELAMQVALEGVALDDDLRTPMTSTFAATYMPCATKLARCRGWIDELAADDVDRGYAAIVSLRLLTGDSHGFNPWADGASRAAARRDWARWLRALERSCAR
jgi:hypothetical protein